MSNGFFSRIGRALSIFGVSSPDDVRRMQSRKAPEIAVKPAPPVVPAGNTGEPASQEKRTEDE